MSTGNPITDRSLVVAYQSGDNTALTALVERWHKKFCTKAFWIVKDPEIAKDIAQDSWRTIMVKINDIKDPDKFGSWALRIVFTKSMDVLRLNSKNRKRKEQYSNEQERLKGEEVDIEPLKTKLLDAIKALPAHQQMVIKLFYVEDYNLKEIAELLTINVGTVKSRLFHARETLKQTLKQYNYENK